MFYTLRNVRPGFRGKLASILFPLFFLSSLTAAASEIAVFLTENGEYHTVAKSFKRGIEVAIGSLPKGDHQPIRLIFLDHDGDPIRARALADSVSTDEEIVAWMGGYPSGCALEIALVAAQKGIPYLIIGSSADTLASGFGANIFRIAPPSSDYNDGILGWAATIIGSDLKIAVVFDDDESWSDALQDLERDLSTRWRGDVENFSFKSGQVDFTDLIESLDKYNPSVVWLICGTIDAASFLRQCRERDWIPNGFIAGVAGLVNRTLISKSENAAEYIVGPAVWWPNEMSVGSDKFLRQYSKRYGQLPDYHAAEAHAAVIVAHEALITASKADISLYEALMLTDVQTPFGRIQFESYNGLYNQNRVRTLALQLSGDRWVSIWPDVFAEANHIYPIPDWRERKTQTAESNQVLLYFLIVVIAVAAMMTMVVAKRREVLRKMGR